MTIGYFTSTFIYYQMVINVSNMVGNTFLNLFLLGLVEGPGNVLGKKKRQCFGFQNFQAPFWRTKWVEDGPTAVSLDSMLSCLELLWLWFPTRSDMRVRADDFNLFSFSSQVHCLWRLDGDPSALHDSQDEHLGNLRCRLHSGNSTPSIFVNRTYSSTFVIYADIGIYAIHICFPSTSFPLSIRD